MKKVFEDDQSYIEIEEKKGKAIITLCARDSPNSANVTMVSVVMEKEELKAMIDKL